MNGKRFRIAFSFAGEKRDFVGQVADILARRFGKENILYDKFHEAEFAVYDLGIKLPRLYGEQSDLIIPVLCSHYDPKRWTGWEWLHIYGLLTKADGHRVMPARFDDANADGLSPAAGFIELDHKTPDQFATLILERLALNEGKPKDHYTKSVAPDTKPLSPPIPNNLPRLQSFFGREVELTVIREALDPESRTWGALIDGPGGMGKTSLAIRAAYDCTGDQFQRIIFVSVKDREMDDDGERSLGNLLVPGFLEMLNEIARELGQADIAKSSEDQRIRLLLDALRPAQVLLILDNLESLPKSDRDQLFTFVKRLPQGCKAILTSRRRIGSSADTLILEKLEQPAALDMLAELARRSLLLAKTSEAERITLYRETGGKPLLLRWVAGQLGRGNCRTFTDVLHFLRTCPERNDPLEFIFGDLANEFTVPETKVLCALTYFTLPASVKHIAALTNPLSEVERELVEPVFRTDSDDSGPKLKNDVVIPQSLSEDEVENALRSLTNRSLVVTDQEEQQFALVPMVAEFLRKHRPEVVHEAGRLLEQRAYGLIVENGRFNFDRFPILDAVWPIVAPALPLFLAGSNLRLQIVSEALGKFLHFTGRWDEELSLGQQAEAKALAVEDYNNAGWRAYEAAMLQSQREQADEVLACAGRAVAHWQRAKAGSRNLAIAIQLRGIGHKLKEDYPAAIALFREALELDRTLSPMSDDVANDLNMLANAKKLSGDYPGAELDYREALRVARAIGSVEGVATITGNLAILVGGRKDWEATELLAREALQLSEDMGRQDLIADHCRSLAYALVRQGKSAEALSFARRSVEIFTRLHLPELADSQKVLQECEGSLL